MDQTDLSPSPAQTEILPLGYPQNILEPRSEIVQTESQQSEDDQTVIRDSHFLQLHEELGNSVPLESKHEEISEFRNEIVFSPKTELKSEADGPPQPTSIKSSKTRKLLEKRA